ncbi:uncharacterized protein JN550_002825 [Neoarthrinium moseri]|uniref:uncharacterized protein n=1 Tax=Neoarthrinium moseri TaxID=1658444 RepID=UPI001FDC81D4|nr:uncharacterized protein JN550_002825 [Neoarthrinium moseri]KAI1874246.1 hypothetical protein JN550_002825 [Neoarthrinium moseri]
MTVTTVPASASPRASTDPSFSSLSNPPPTTTTTTTSQHPHHRQHRRPRSQTPPRPGRGPDGGPPADDQDVYVLTLLTDPGLQAHMSGLRRRYFPPARLKVDAHVTLFHALPGARLGELRRDLAGLAGATQRFGMCVAREGVFRMGRGVGVGVDARAGERARGLREGLRSKWEPWLSDQDRRKAWNGHYTVMNKENDSEKVEVCLEQLKGGLSDSTGEVRGLRLWRYDRGWWREAEDFLFRGMQDTDGDGMGQR